MRNFLLDESEVESETNKRTRIERLITQTLDIVNILSFFLTNFCLRIVTLSHWQIELFQNRSCVITVFSCENFRLKFVSA